MNIKISHQRYHWMTKQKMRNKKAKRWTKDFVEQEENDRNNRQLYSVPPSPKSREWRFYIKHRLKMLERGIETYCTDRYTRLNLDKYIERNRAMDQISGFLVANQPAIVHLGGAEFAPDRPIHIKKHLRCPGYRQMANSYKKRDDCDLNIVDEYYTSQTCAKCFRRFARHTKRNRFKVCLDCRPSVEAMLPSMIVGKHSKRTMRMMKLMEFLKEKEEEDNANQVDGFVAPPNPNQPNAGSSLPKVKIHVKEWLVNPVSGVLEYVNAKQPAEIEVVDWANHQPQIHKTVWHRDIVAAKCIMIKGLYF